MHLTMFILKIRVHIMDDRNYRLRVLSVFEGWGRGEVGGPKILRGEIPDNPKSRKFQADIQVQISDLKFSLETHYPTIHPQKILRLHLFFLKYSYQSSDSK